MKTYGEMGALDGGDWPPQRSCSFVPSYDAGSAPEPVWMLWRREKSLTPEENRTPAIQPTARRYND
jgi:hypothetical protein